VLERCGVTIEKVTLDDFELDETVGHLRGVRAALAEVSLVSLRQVLAALERAYANGQTFFLCGNGGSAATASHFAVDLGKGTRSGMAPPIRAISLADQLPAMTAWANDEDFSAVFSAQLVGLARPGDVVIAISTSGNSANVLEALRYGRQAGAVNVALLGAHGGQARHLADAYVLAPGRTIEQQEDVHLVLAHAIARHMRGVVRAAGAVATAQATGRLP
jgi:D-sedoheptulose 7-phosphate isomerase